MPEFSYKGVTAADGKPVSGRVDAVDRKQALAKLRQQGVRPLQVVHGGAQDAAGATSVQGSTAGQKPPRVGGTAQAGVSAVAAAMADAGADGMASVYGGDSVAVVGGGGNSGAFARFRSARTLALPFLLKFRQLHGSGMPLGEVLQVMANRMSDPQLKLLSQDLYKDLSEGRTLAAAIRSRPDIFEPTMSYLVEAGEATGNLVPILDNIIEHLQTNRALAKKIRSALAYPLLITTMALAVVGIFLFFLVPRIESMMDSMGGQMGFIARLMIGMSEFALHQGPFLLGALLLAVLVVLRWRKTPRGRRKTDEWLLRLPLVRSLAYNAEICRATNVLAILLGNGVNTTESLRLAENTLQNAVLRARFSAARNSINDGSNFSAAFKRYGLLPDLDIDILNVGESTGSLVTSFQEVYRSHAEELTARLSMATNLVSGLALGFAFTLIFILTLSIVLSVMGVSQSMLS